MKEDLINVGRAIAVPARAAMVEILMDGGEHTAGELAARAGVGSATASQHLAVLLRAGVASVRASGRNRYFSLASVRLAEAVESIVTPKSLPQVTSLRLSREQQRLRGARMCYDHLAGMLGVALAESFAAHGWVDDDYTLITASGRAILSNHFGIDVENHLLSARRPMLRGCIDWTERRIHMAGASGCAIANAALTGGWVLRRDGDRGLFVSEAGRQAFARIGVRVQA